MFCRKCGTQLPDDAMFCGECGAPTRNHPSQQQAQSQPQQGQIYQEQFRQEQQYQGQQYQQQYQGQPYQQQYQGYPEQQQYQQYYGQQPGNGASDVKAKFKGGPKRTIITVAIIAVIAVAAGLLYNFVLKSESPQDTIAELEKAIEDLDLEAMIACFDEETRQMYEESMSSIDGVDMDQALTSVLGLAGGLGVGPEVNLTVTDIEYTDNENCLVYVEMEFSFMGESDEDSSVIPMSKEGRRWVIDASMASDILGGLF